MNFEESYKKYVEGTATAEEKEFVEAEMEKSKRLFEIIDRIGPPEIDRADGATIKKAKKKFILKSAARTAIIAFAVVVIIASAVCGGVFGTAVSAAKKDLVISRAQAENIAVTFVADNFKSAGKIIVNDCEKTLRVKPKLSRSVYVYEIEVFNGIAEFDLVVDGKTGLVTIE